ncbi:MAG: hypothetical protein PHV34_20365 [Verrucomicrobiae bacterium]|nr:hypothetical protein [Verrucomicrobiae bacterium]
MEAFLTSIGTSATTIAGYVTTAAGSALCIFVAIYGVRWVLRAVKAVK